MSEPIVFFGSGPVAAESLRLLAREFTIEAVITKPRMPHHKGDVPVLSLAEELKLATYTATKASDIDKLIDSRIIKSQIGILIDFGIIISQEVIDYFPLGIINSHFSILPEWRGADPITFAILSGQKQTGVSLMLVVKAMDEGPILSYGEYDMPKDITNPELTDYLISLSHALLKEVVPKYIAGDIPGAPQTISGRAVSYSRKLTKEDGTIDWNKSAAAIEREIRAFIAWPRSRTAIGGHDVIITAAHIAPSSTSAIPGTLETADKQLGVHTSEGLLIIDRLLPLGKKEMTAAAFLAGYSVN